MIDVCKVGIWAHNRILASIQLLFHLHLFIAMVLLDSLTVTNVGQNYLGYFRSDLLQWLVFEIG